MSKVRSLHSHRATEGRVSGRIWQALLIFTPLLLLAGLGVRGLQVNRRAVLDEPRERVSRDLKRVLAAWDDPFQSPDVQDEWVRIYLIPPRPVPPNPARELYRKATPQGRFQAFVPLVLPLDGSRSAPFDAAVFSRSNRVFSACRPNCPCTFADRYLCCSLLSPWR